MEHFSKYNDLVITKADKDGATVILDVKHYIEKANENLQDNIFYWQLHLYPTAKHSEIVNSATESFKKQEILSKPTSRKLTVDEVKTPQFHILPKNHKLNIPGRPVASQSNVIQVNFQNSLITFFSHIPNHCLHI